MNCQQNGKECENSCKLSSKPSSCSRTSLNAQTSFGLIKPHQYGMSVTNPNRTCSRPSFVPGQWSFMSINQHLIRPKLVYGSVMFSNNQLVERKAFNYCSFLCRSILYFKVNKSSIFTFCSELLFQNLFYEMTCNFTSII